MILSRDQILQAHDIVTQDVECPEWGGTVRVRALSIKEINEWNRGLLRPVPKTDPKSRGVAWDYKFDEALAEMSTVRMLTLACIDEQGNRLFTGPSDLDALSGKSQAPIARLVKAVRTISGLDQNAEEEAEKNS